MSNKPSLLLHSCCGPCSTVCIKRLKEDYNITVLYFNPCIYPETEFIHRKNEQKRFLETQQIPMLESDYAPEKYFEAVKGLENEPEGGKRCSICFRQRLFETAKIAKENNFDFFSTTLTVSPHKNSLVINDIGKKIEVELEIKYLEQNFKKQNGYLESIRIAKEYDLYRQNYCGCKFSMRK